MVGQIVAYVRVSSSYQCIDRQTFEGVSVDKTFTDKCSGSTRNRPALTEMLGYVREGDTIVCHSIDRLARDLGDLMRLVQILTRRGTSVRFMKEGQIAARTKGRLPGRKPKLSPEQVTELNKRVADREPKAQIARDLGISRETLYSYLNTT